MFPTNAFRSVSLHVFSVNNAHINCLQIANLLKTFKQFIRDFGHEGDLIIDFVDKDLV